MSSCMMLSCRLRLSHDTDPSTPSSYQHPPSACIPTPVSASPCYQYPLCTSIPPCACIPPSTKISTPVQASPPCYQHPLGACIPISVPASRPPPPTFHRHPKAKGRQEQAGRGALPARERGTSPTRGTPLPSPPSSLQLLLFFPPPRQAGKTKRKSQ